MILVEYQAIIDKISYNRQTLPYKYHNDCKWVRTVIDILISCFNEHIYALLLFINVGTY